MQVFKLYWKVLKKYLGFIFMYVGIFSGMLMGFIIPAQSGDTEAQFENAQSKFAVFDYDNSELSKGLTSALEEKHIKVEIADDKMETMQDELYGRNVSCVVIIEEGFEDAVKSGEAKEYLTVYEVNGSISSMLLKQDVTGTLTMVDTYLAADYSVKEALEATLDNQKLEVKVSLPDGNNAATHTPESIFFTYIAWIFVAMIITGITPILLAINKKVLRERVYCSSYRFSKMNMEVLLGVIITGVVICVAFFLFALVLFPEAIVSIKGVLYGINMLVYMLVALAITYTVSNCTDNPQVVSIIANVVSLGMAFLSGIFVPMELLSDTVIKIAHFLPAYWYERAVRTIENFAQKDLVNVFMYMGIEILFALAIVIVGLAISRKKQVA